MARKIKIGNYPGLKLTSQEEGNFAQDEGYPSAAKGGRIPFFSEEERESFLKRMKKKIQKPSAKLQKRGLPPANYNRGPSGPQGPYHNHESNHNH